MKTALFFCGPIIATIGFGFYSGLLEFAHKLEGLEHQAGVEMGGTFALEYRETYQCDENDANCVLVEESTEFSEIDGLEIEETPIEYREGSDDIHVRKQPGIAKYANITLRRPSGFNWKSLKFEFERQAAIEEFNKEFDQKINEAESEGAEMYQIDPPTLVIPAG